MRKMTWALILWSEAMIGVLIVGVLLASSSPARWVAASAAVVLWFVGFVALSLVWFMSRAR